MGKNMVTITDKDEDVTDGKKLQGEISRLNEELKKQNKRILRLKQNTEIRATARYFDVVFLFAMVVILVLDRFPPYISLSITMLVILYLYTTRPVVDDLSE